MPKNPLDKLEELIPNLVEESRQLREDNLSLQKEIKTCRSELERTRKEETRLQGKVQRMGELEIVQKRMERDHSQIRSTVKNLLQGIEKIGINS